MRRHVKRIQSPRVAHHRANRQRFTTRARAEISDHLATFRPEQMGQQLAALILHLNCTRGEHIQFLQRRFFQQTQAQRRHFAGQRINACVLKRLHDLGFARLDRVHTHIQRRGLIQGGGQLQSLLLAIRGDQRLEPFIGQIAAHRCRQAVHRRVQHLLQPNEFFLGNGRLQTRQIHDFLRTEQNQAPPQRARAGLRQMREHAAMAQDRINRLRHDVTVARAQFLVSA